MKSDVSKQAVLLRAINSFDVSGNAASFMILHSQMQAKSAKNRKTHETNE